ncbi:hypothetical protein CJD36_006420 [Flavipsychrobacter stenotrophus]|uniref:Uncharacterized protein n=1 Tax=Flavipsychrobacter stenotrophus TaxID=2077091 RepID=A0A2S7SWY0_9BACT|nr:hypothetical protein CJD36_006420 [Flavipsychrobacter stenotrophus]
MRLSLRWCIFNVRPFPDDHNRLPGCCSSRLPTFFAPLLRLDFLFFCCLFLLLFLFLLFLLFFLSLFFLLSFFALVFFFLL